MQRDLEILFPTDFSDSCYRVIPAVAQMVDDLRVRITLLHAHDPGESDRAEAEERIQSFFAEAHHYGACRRIVAEGEVSAVVRDYAAREQVDLVVAPSSNRLGLPRFLRRSTRGRLLSAVPAPLWTSGVAAEKRDFSGGLRRIACWIDFETRNLTHLRLAAQMASHMNARLDLLNVTPTIDESLLASAMTDTRPLHPAKAERRLQELLAGVTCKTEIHVAAGEVERELPRLLRDCRADLVYLGEGQALRSVFGSPSMAATIEALPCPAICCDGAAAMAPDWPLQSRLEKLPPRTLPVLSPAGAPALSDLRPAFSPRG